MTRERLRSVLGRLPLRTLACVLVTLCLLGCDGTPDVAPPDDGQQRLRQVLDDLAEYAARENDWFGDAAVRALRLSVEKDARGLRDDAAAELYADLGMAELRLGMDDAALHSLGTALELVQRAGADEHRAKLLEVLFRTGVAHMRVAEKRNCVRHHTSESCLLPIQGDGVHVDRGPARSAIAAFERVLALDPDHVSARWLLNIAYMAAGGYPQDVPAEYVIEPEALTAGAPFPRFDEIAAGVGLATLSLAGGAVLEDLDGDDLVDVLVSTWDPGGELHYYRNRGDGRFEDRTRAAGLEGLGGCLNMVHADYDGDGDADVLLLRGGWMADEGQIPNSLLRNDGVGRFTDVTYAAGLGYVHYPTQTAAWADYDADGDLDLYVGNETTSVMWSPCQLFRNDGDGTFTEVAEEAGVSNERMAKAVAWGDFDGDRDPDLYVANLGGANRLYRNEGDGTFTDVAAELGVTGPERSFPCWFWDFDNDGRLDLFVAAYASDWGASALAQSDEILAPYLGRPSAAPLPALYRANAGGGFDDVAREFGLTRPNLPMGSNFGDLDNDGFPDFYLGTGDPSLDNIVPNVMFHNVGGERFEDVSVAGGFSHLQKGHAVAFADLDNDGDLDVFEQMGGAYKTDVFADALYRNPGFGNHWLTVQLTGVTSNRSAIGARIKAEIVEDGRRRSVYRHVGSGGSFGASPLRQTLGLGKADEIAVLEIHWPTTGRTQRFEAVGADRFVEITEDVDEIRTVRVPRFALGE